MFVAADVDRTRRLYKQLVKTATIVECWGLKPRDGRRPDPRQVARQAEVLVKQAATEAGRQIEPAAARLVAERAGTDIARLRGDVERLMLYSAGAAKISLADAREVVSAESSQDDWAVTNAISARQHRGGAAGTRPVARFGRRAVHDPGAARLVRAREAGRRSTRGGSAARSRRCSAPTLDLKSSGGDPRVLLERLVVELCGKVGTP